LGVTPFLKASLKNPLQLVTYSRVVANFRGSSRRLFVEFLTVPVCAFVLLAMVCPTGIDLAVVADLSWLLCRYYFLHDGYLAIIGSSGGYFAAVVVGRFYPSGCLAVGGISGECFAATGSLVPSLAHLMPRACWPSSWWMLGHRGLRWRMLCRRWC
jgi:hypothetical protein